MIQELAMTDKAVENHFAVMVERWCLEDFEIEELVCAELFDVRPGVWNSRTERAVRMLIELDRLLCSLIGVDGVASWLRDSDGTGMDPLTFMSLDNDHLRAMLLAARYREETLHDSGTFT